MLAISTEKRLIFKREGSTPRGNKYPAVCQVSAQNLESADPTPPACHRISLSVCFHCTKEYFWTTSNSTVETSNGSSGEIKAGPLVATGSPVSDCWFYLWGALLAQSDSSFLSLSLLRISFISCALR